MDESILGQAVVDENLIEEIIARKYGENYTLKVRREEAYEMLSEFVLKHKMLK